MKSSHGITPRQAHLLLLFASAIWGVAFVAQRVGMRYIGPLTFNGVRFALGALALIPLAVRGRTGPRQPVRPVLVGGLIAGLVLFCGTTLQQYGVVVTTAGKAGFITSLYVVLVPVLGLAIGQRVDRLVWVGVMVCAAGLYLLSARGLTSLAPGDGLVLIGAVFWAVHVLVIGRLAGDLRPVELAVVQFSVVAVLSGAGAAMFEPVVWSAVLAATEPILYAGLLSVAVAYTLQVMGQTHAKPASAAVILSLESVFAAVGGWLLLGEMMGLRELTGCGLMLAGVLLAQRPDRA